MRGAAPGAVASGAHGGSAAASAPHRPATPAEAAEEASTSARPNPQQLLLAAGLLGAASPSLPPEVRRAAERVWTAIVRGAGAAVLIKGGLHTLTFVVYFLGKLRGGKAARGGRARTISLHDAVADTCRFTAFFAALGGSYTAVDEGLALLLGKDR